MKRQHVKIKLTSRQKNCLYNALEPIVDDMWLEGRKRDTEHISHTLNRLAKSDYGKTSVATFTRSQFDLWIKPHMERCRIRR